MRRRRTLFIGGGKQSIAFHENGKKHKEIVALSLKDMRMRGRERRIEKAEMDKEMQKLERAARVHAVLCMWHICMSARAGGSILFHIIRGVC